MTFVKSVAIELFGHSSVFHRTLIGRIGLRYTHYTDVICAQIEESGPLDKSIRK